MTVSFPIYDKLGVSAMRFHIDNRAAKECRNLLYNQSEAPAGLSMLPTEEITQNLHNLKHMPYARIWIEGLNLGQYKMGYLITQTKEDPCAFFIEYAITFSDQLTAFSFAMIFVNLNDETPVYLMASPTLLEKNFSNEQNQRIIESVAGDCWAVLSYATSFLAMLHTKQFLDERKVVHEYKDPKYLAKLAARGKQPPQKDYIVLSLSEKALEHVLHMEEKCSGSSKRMHHRRGHFRKAYDKIFWISPCVVGYHGELKQKDYIID